MFRLPEPYSEVEDHPAELAEELSIGFLLLLETLPPADRVSYVLREGFDYSFAEIAEVLNISAATARQRAHRARRRLREAARGPLSTPADEQRKLLESLMIAVSAGDADALVSLMSEDVVAYTDGGGVVSAAIRPVTGRERVAQIILHLVAKAEAEAPLDVEFVRLNDGWGLLASQAGQLHSTVQVAGDAGRLSRFYVMRNPNKLAHLARDG